MNTTQFKEKVRSTDVDLVGIAPIARFAGIPPEAHPSAIKPDTRSVIVLGFRITRGGMRGVESGNAMYTLGQCNPAGYISLLVENTYRICCNLENQGWEAVPMWQHSEDMRHQGLAVSPDKPELDVIMDLYYAAHAAGLGEMGRSKLFLTPEFGPRQVFTAILTDAEFEYDEPFSGSVCDNCGACATACPAAALSADHMKSAPLCEGEAHWYGLRIESCRICKTGVMANPYTTGAEPLRMGAACGRACVAHLEDSGLLKRSFKNRFREPATV